MTTMEFPNSPGVEIIVTRGGTDPITGEQMSDQMVTFEWTEVVDGEERKARRSFLGPA